MYRKSLAAIAIALMAGFGSTAFASEQHSHARHAHHLARATAPMFHSRPIESSHLPNWGFGCDPDFGPNGFNPCNP